jgi:hypothetical protein
VLLPTFGLPTMATKPAKVFISDFEGVLIVGQYAWGRGEAQGNRQ